MNNKFLTVSGAVILLMVIIIWQLITSPSRSATVALESVSSILFRTRVNVSDMSIDLEKGKASIGSMSIANPVGYSAGPAFLMNDIEVEFQPGSLEKDLLIISSIQVNDPKVSYEGLGPGGTNMELLLKRVSRVQAAIPTTGIDSHLKVIIEKLALGTSQVKASSVTSPENISSVDFPPIELSGIGRDQDGVNTTEAARLAASELVKAMISAGMDAGIIYHVKKSNRQWINAFRDRSKPVEPDKQD